MRKVFLEGLPRWEKELNKNKIDWNKSIGCKVSFIYDEIKGEIEIVDYDGHYLYIKYLDKEIFRIFTGHFSKCNLGKLLGKATINEYKYNIGDIVKNDVSEIKILEQIRIKQNSTTRENRTEKGYKYQCLNCNNIDTIRESDIQKGVGCNVCGLTSKKVLRGYNDIATTHSHLVKYFANIEDAYTHSYGSGDIVNMICPNCNTIKSMEISRLFKGIFPCSNCGDGFSRPNKIMFNILQQLNIDFISEYNPDWIKPKRYDFYFEIDNKGYIVEMDGGFHYRDNDMSGISSKKAKEMDNYKDKLAKEHNIKVIRIDSQESKFNYIKDNIISSKLSELFDLSNINWLKCEEFALSNRVKEACDLWNGGIKSVKEIKEIMKLDGSTVTIYLKQGVKLEWCDYKTTSEIKKENIIKASELWNSGIESVSEISKLLNVKISASRNYLIEATKLGLCVYDAEDSRQKGLISNHLAQQRPIICLDNNTIYNSIRETSKIFLELYNIKLDESSISKVCRGKIKSHKGYHFKYVDDSK